MIHDRGEVVRIDHAVRTPWVATAEVSVEILRARSSVCSVLHHDDESTQRLAQDE